MAHARGTTPGEGSIPGSENVNLTNVAPRRLNGYEEDVRTHQDRFTGTEGPRVNGTGGPLINRTVANGTGVPLINRSNPIPSVSGTGGPLIDRNSLTFNNSGGGSLEEILGNAIRGTGGPLISRNGEVSGTGGPLLDGYGVDSPNGGRGGEGGLGGELGGQSGPADHRVRIRAKPGMEGEIYGDGPIGILNDTNGMVFPYTPVISWAQTVNYSPLNLVHVNQDFHYYGSTPNLTLTISGRFTAQNTMQAQYCFACIHFLRTVSKMRFGTSDEKRGLPPPMLVLDGYGDQMFNQLPIFINQFNIELLNDVDYVRVPMNAGEAWVPSEFSIGMNVIIQNTPAQWRDQFNLDAFRNGELLGGTKGWI